jgi:hypothetical protein
VDVHTTVWSSVVRMGHGSNSCPVDVKHTL